MKSLLIKINSLVLAVFLLLSVLLFSGCQYQGYTGEGSELCAVAWDNIPFLYGYISDGERTLDADVKLIETDSFGRVMFSYTEELSPNGYYILIMQYSEGDVAYYYPDDCYVYLPLKDEDGGSPNIYASEVVKLKEINDWELPRNEHKCKSATVSTVKPDGELHARESTFENIVRDYHEDSGRYIHPENTEFVNRISFVSADNYGRELYAVDTGFDEYSDKKHVSYNFKFLVILNSNKKCDASGVLLVSDYRNAQNNIKALKEKNGWNVEP